MVDPRYKVHFLNLDDFISSEDKPDWLISNLFSLDCVGNVLKREQAQFIVDSTPNRNSSKGRMGKDRPKVLDEALRKRVFNSTVLKESFGKLEKISGSVLWR